MPLSRPTKIYGAAVCLLCLVSSVRAETIWVEGEKPTKSTLNRHPWYNDVKKDQLSGGDWISNFADKKPAEAEYSVTAKERGQFEFWVRANPTATKLSYRLNDANWKPIEFEKNASDGANIAGVLGAELINEDSFFFWTFNEKNIPDQQLRMLEQEFGLWLKQKHGSINNALAAWKGQKIGRDAPADGRVGFRPLWNIAHERTPRDQETAQFLTGVQRRF